MTRPNENITASAPTNKILEGLDRIGSSLESLNAEAQRLHNENLRLQRNLDIYRDGEIAK